MTSEIDKLYSREWSRAYRARLTPEEREEINARARVRDRAKRAAETPEQRAERLKRTREYIRAKRAAETPEQRAERLRKHRAIQAAYKQRLLSKEKPHLNS